MNAFNTHLSVSISSELHSFQILSLVLVLQILGKNKAWTATEWLYCVFEKTSYELHESVISLWRMEMSNPKGQRLESAFPLPRGLSCFSWAMHAPVRTSLYLHICVYSGACGAESRQSKGALGQALCQRPAAALVPQDLWPRQTGPCFCRWRAEVHVTETSQKWLRKLVKDWTQQLSSKECRASDRATSPEHCLLPSGRTQKSSLGESPDEEVPEQQWQPQGLCLCRKVSWWQSCPSSAGKGNLMLTLLPCSCSFHDLFMANSRQYKSQ